MLASVKVLIRHSHKIIHFSTCILDNFCYEDEAMTGVHHCKFQ